MSAAQPKKTSLRARLWERGIICGLAVQTMSDADLVATAAAYKRASQAARKRRADGRWAGP